MISPAVLGDDGAPLPGVFGDDGADFRPVTLRTLCQGFFLCNVKRPPEPITLTGVPATSDSNQQRLAGLSGAALANGRGGMVGSESKGQTQIAKHATEYGELLCC